MQLVIFFAFVNHFLILTFQYLIMKDSRNISTFNETKDTLLPKSCINIIKIFYVRQTIYSPALRFFQSILDLPRGNTNI